MEENAARQQPEDSYEVLKRKFDSNVELIEDYKSFICDGEISLRILHSHRQLYQKSIDELVDLIFKFFKLCDERAKSKWVKQVQKPIVEPRPSWLSSRPTLSKNALGRKIESPKPPEDQPQPSWMDLTSTNHSSSTTNFQGWSMIDKSNDDEIKVETDVTEESEFEVDKPTDVEKVTVMEKDIDKILDHEALQYKILNKFGYRSYLTFTNNVNLSDSAEYEIIRKLNRQKYISANEETLIRKMEYIFNPYALEELDNDGPNIFKNPIKLPVTSRIEAPTPVTHKFQTRTPTAKPAPKPEKKSPHNIEFSSKGALSKEQLTALLASKSENPYKKSEVGKGGGKLDPLYQKAKEEKKNKRLSEIKPKIEKKKDKKEKKQKKKKDKRPIDSSSDDEPVEKKKKKEKKKKMKKKKEARKIVSDSDSETENKKETTKKESSKPNISKSKALVSSDSDMSDIEASAPVRSEQKAPSDISKNANKKVSKSPSLSSLDDIKPRPVPEKKKIPEMPKRKREPSSSSLSSLDDDPKPKKKISKPKQTPKKKEKAAVFKCFSCLKVRDIGREHGPRKRHPKLQTAICIRCEEFLGDCEGDDWTYSADDGKCDYCLISGDGGDIISCDVCVHSYSSKCLRAWLGNEKFEYLNEHEDEEFRCFKCDKNLGNYRKFLDLTEKYIETYRSTTGIQKAISKKPLISSSDSEPEVKKKIVKQTSEISFGKDKVSVEEKESKVSEVAASVNIKSDGGSDKDNLGDEVQSGLISFKFNKDKEISPEAPENPKSPTSESIPKADAIHFSDNSSG